MLKLSELERDPLSPTSQSVSIHQVITSLVYYLLYVSLYDPLYIGMERGKLQQIF